MSAILVSQFQLLRKFCYILHSQLNNWPLSDMMEMIYKILQQCWR